MQNATRESSGYYLVTCLDEDGHIVTHLGKVELDDALELFNWLCEPNTRDKLTRVLGMRYYEAVELHRPDRSRMRFHQV